MVSTTITTGLCAMRYLIWAAGIYYLGQGVVMWAWPLAWYEATPGVAMTGPFNLHFVRDIALIHAVSGLAILHGIRLRSRDVLITGIAWPALHASYHAVMWIGRGVPFDLIALVNLGAIQIPAWTTLALILSISKQENRT